ncbi:MAG TPA: hypothetical protein VNO52_11755, partial [Methylomirabilota bacterium]|nr:hypothetical protein [Methylomirabilota bacterium]
MNETNTTGATARRRLRLRRFLFGLAGLVLLLAACYLTVTSSFFLKSVILPRVGEALRARVTVADAALSPFSRLVLHDLRIEPDAGEPLLAVGEMRVRYSLMDMLGGRIRVEEIAVVAPVVNLVVKADGSTNLDPLLSSGAGQDSPPPAPSSGSPPEVDLRLLLITNATLRVSIERPAGRRARAEISGCNLALENVRNGQEARLAFAAAWKFDQTSTVTNLAAHGRCTAAFTLGLTAGLYPAAARGQGRLEIQEASGAAEAARGLAAALTLDVTPAELKALDGKVERDGTVLAEWTARGPFDATRREGDLVVSVQGIGREALNLAGAAAGVDFGSTIL